MDGPDFGIVFDAMWCVRAEKGIERPAFRITRGNERHGGIWIDSLDTAPGPANQIAGTATAIIKASDRDVLERFYRTVSKRYQDFGFDDQEYRRARFDTPVMMDGAVKLVTHVEGAQHGSAPQENREFGSNPLVSLANFLAYLVGTGELAGNAVGTMVEFIRWGWGTKVFGEYHPKLLEAHDRVFVQGNGTTYAVTKLVTERHQVRLEIDVRYAIDHHEQPWDGKTEGLLAGESRFKHVFAELTRDFNSRNVGHAVEYETATAFAHDIRLPTNPQFTRVNRAYRAVTGDDCSFIGIGGGTDAKGHPELIAVGPLFSPKIGPPINFHGRDEGAPLEHLKTSALIMYKVMINEIEHVAESGPVKF